MPGYTQFAAVMKPDFFSTCAQRSRMLRANGNWDRAQPELPARGSDYLLRGKISDVMLFDGSAALPTRGAEGRPRGLAVLRR